MNSEELQKKYGNLPRHVRESLLATENTQPSDEPEEVEETQEPEIEQPTQEVEETIEEKAEPEHVADRKEERHHDDNEVKAWKGRLSKEQQARKEYESKYLKEQEERRKYEEKVRAEEERRLALEKELESLRQPKQEPQQTEIEDDFTQEELDEIKFALGGVGDKLIKRLKQPKATKDVDEVINQRFEQERQRTLAEQQAVKFQQALATTVPDIQSLVMDSGFNEFIENEVVDFYGNKAVDLLRVVGQTHDIEKLPMVKALVDKYKQQAQPPQQTATRSPSSAGNVVSRKPRRKKALTPEVKNKMRILMNTGRVQELRALQDEYEI